MALKLAKSIALLCRVSRDYAARIPWPGLQLAPSPIPLGFQPYFEEETANSSVNDSLFRDGLLFAAPKKRTSKARKKERNKPKALKPIRGLVTCRACGNTKKMHYLCPFCYPFIKWISGKDNAVERFQSFDRLYEKKLEKERLELISKEDQGVSKDRER